LTPEEEEKKSRELIDQLLAQEMQEEYELEQQKYENMMQMNMAIERDLEGRKGPTAH
jgi:hypothetical protein